MSNQTHSEVIQHDDEELPMDSRDRSQPDCLADFRSQCETNLARDIKSRMRYGFCYVYKPVLDDADWRSFASTADYRSWCRENLPVYLGYGAPEQPQVQERDETR